MLRPEPGTVLGSARDDRQAPYLVRYGRQAMASILSYFSSRSRRAWARGGVARSISSINWNAVDRLSRDERGNRVESRAATEPVAVEPRLFSLLNRAVELYRETAERTTLRGSVVARVGLLAA